MSLYEDREAYREAVHNQPFDVQVKQIAKEMDRLAAFGNDGRMFRMQVAGVLEAARSCGYVLAREKPGLLEKLR
jgi:hypothetical protein